MDDHTVGVLRGVPSTASDRLTAMQVQAIHPPRFDPATQGPELAAYLENHGYVVVGNVCPDLPHARGLFWDWLEAVPNTQVRRDDPLSWASPTDWLPSPTNGIVTGFGFGQSPFAWHLRLLPRVKQTFAQIWGTSDLLVSFDGGNAFRPWSRNPSFKTAGGWFHVDQNWMRGPSRQGRVSVQGFVTLFDATEETGGLVVVPSSHAQHRELCERIPIARAVGDFVPVPPADPVLADGARLVCAKAGDLVLWDSRTVHCNTPALAGAGGSGEELIRLVAYVCMTPATWASAEVLEKRKVAFVEGASTSHWPHDCVMAGAAVPGAEPNDPEAASAEQRRLIGYDRPAPWYRTMLGR